MFLHAKMKELTISLYTISELKLTIKRQNYITYPLKIDYKFNLKTNSPHDLGQYVCLPPAKRIEHPKTKLVQLNAVKESYLLYTYVYYFFIALVTTFLCILVAYKLENFCKISNSCFGTCYTCAKNCKKTTHL